jgi:hypothetical protein
MQRLILLVLSVAGTLAMSAPLAGQSLDELKRKYGEPISQTFVVRPDISVTATYAANGRITELLIAPRITDLIKSRGRTLSRDTVEAIVQQLVPSSARGKFLISTFLNVTCLPENDCAGTSESYEKVTIYYNSAQAGQVYYAVVHLKR